MLGIAEHSTPVAPNDAARLVSTLLDIIEEASPLPTGRHKDLRRDVLELWRELTSEKSTRQPDYIGEPAKLAAYLRYFLPWNIVRLTPLLADMDLGLKPGDGVIDIGLRPDPTHSPVDSQARFASHGATHRLRRPCPSRHGDRRYHT
ncbi:hypothetical protein MASR2M48_21500 [Spirochaetota bacterium]